MSLEELQSEITGLSWDEMNLLHDFLSRSLKEKSETAFIVNLCNEKGNRYVNAMNRIVGRNILEEKRDTIHVWGRNFVIWQLFQDGLTECQIGQILGKDHSTINHSKKMVKDMIAFPALYRQETKMWTEFQLAIL